jgi:WD40 repeat protein
MHALVALLLAAAPLSKEAVVERPVQVVGPLAVLAGAPIHADGVRGLAFTPDGKTLLSGDSSGRLVEWDAKERKVRRSFATAGYAVAAVVMRPDGGEALVLGYSQAWRWKPGAKELAEAPGLDGGARWSPDGKLLVLSDSSRVVQLVDGTTGKPLRTLGTHQPHDAERQNLMTPSSTAFSPDGKQLAVARWDQPTAIWDVATGTQLRTLPGTLHVDWSPDGKTLALDQGRISKRMTKLELLVVDAASGETRYTAPYPEARFSPDGRFLAALDDGGVVLLEPASGKVLTRLFSEGHRPGVFAFSADGKLLATGGEDATVRLWAVPR